MLFRSSHAFLLRNDCALDSGLSGDEVLHLYSEVTPYPSSLPSTTLPLALLAFPLPSPH